MACDGETARCGDQQPCASCVDRLTAQMRLTPHLSSHAGALTKMMSKPDQGDLRLLHDQARSSDSDCAERQALT